MSDAPFVGEFVGHGQERVTGFPRAVEFPQGVRQVERAERRIREHRAQRVRHVRRVIPLLRVAVNLAADLKDFGMSVPFEAMSSALNQNSAGICYMRCDRFLSNAALGRVEWVRFF